ncbi:NAD(P)-dependent oxidoreductase [Streptomyces sp. SID12488]|uniref:NAD(P)-dependent oxidoreductase n=1 Tax=Streptomyces sp. SID12488 TaxID=2706040 RepID=UPI0013DB3297|nr:NAD(P)-dependent oxidoreductase [Streptomyces sp. SID12488]NEA63873.1 NAD(P)-dependent oxidoreductase [Streptomyces sp. SID12488]
MAAAPGVADTNSEAEAVTGSDLVLSVNSASHAEHALRAGLAGMSPGTLWADLNTASPALKRHLGEIAGVTGIAFADVSLMATVPGRGLRTPLLVSGVGAGRYAAMLRSLRADVDVLDGPAGLAAERKLLRSVFYKGLAAAAVEALDAARAAGCEEWLRQIIAEELTCADSTTLDRLVRGSHRHAVRRTAEMQAAADMLGDLDVPPLIATASRDLLHRLTRERKAGSNVSRHDTNGPRALPTRRSRRQGGTPYGQPASRAVTERDERRSVADQRHPRLPRRRPHRPGIPGSPVRCLPQDLLSPVIRLRDDRGPSHPAFTRSQSNRFDEPNTERTGRQSPRHRPPGPPTVGASSTARTSRPPKPPATGR